MNSSDDPIDKSLRDHFQQVFDDFEVQPAASLKTRIWQRINVPTKKRRPYSILLFGVLLVIGTGLYIRLYQARVRSYETKIQPITVAESSRKDKSDKITKEQASGSSYSHHFTHTTNSAATESVQSTIDVQRKKEHREDDLPERFVNVAAGKAVSLHSKTHKISRQLANGRHIARVNRTSSDSFTVFTGSVAQSRKRVSKPAMIRSETSEISVATPSGSPAQTAESVEEDAVSWKSLRSLTVRPIGGMGTQIGRNVHLSALASSPSEQPKSRRTPVRWLIGVAPLSTYQLMTVVAKPDAYVQRVDAPSAFSGPTWGYQLSGGVEWRTFDFQLSFGQIRRWAYYDLATDVFQVRPVGASKYQITSLDQPVAENVSLTMLGASINKQYRLGGVHSRYVARLGGQTSYVPASNQTLIWAKAALGLTLPLHRVYQLQVGPTVEYGFSRLWSNERQLIIHPYLIGAAITIRPTKP